jgi:predicted DNA-binding transcriptional regulator AlpA
MKSMQHEILKVKDVAEMLRLSTRQIHNLCKSDAHTPLPHIKVNGHSLRFRRADIDAWMTKNLISAI